MPLLSSTRLYSGRIVNLDLDSVRFPDDSVGQLEMLRHPGASAVVPFLDPPGEADPRVVLIRQFRHAADGFIWEIPAGRLDAGESPETCASRELEEETGMRARRLERLTTILTTPGFTDERIHLFLAQGLEPGAEHREADEFMELHTLRWSEVLRLVESGEIVDGKTLVSLLFVQCFHR
jgi:ADP-ribose pyrophosphatase